MSDFSMVQNTTKILQCTIYDSDGRTLLDISESPEIKFGVKYYGQGNSDAIFTKQLGDGVAIMGIGLIQVTIHPEDTNGIIGKLQYELRITDAQNNVFVPITGLCTVHTKSV